MEINWHIAYVSFSAFYSAVDNVLLINVRFKASRIDASGE